MVMILGSIRLGSTVKEPQVLLAHWDGIQWTAVDEETASGLRVAMRFARVSGYGELNPSITLLVPWAQRRIVEEHHTRWQWSREKV